MNIVILTGAYYPNMSATSACIDKYIQILKNKHSIDVVCPLSQVHFEPLNDPKIKLHFVFSRMWKWRMLCEENIRNGRNVMLNKVVVDLFRIRSLLLSPISYPIVEGWQMNPFYHELEKIDQDKTIDVIISVVNPICSVFASRRFKLKHPKVKWITFITDPFTFQPSKYKYVFFPNRRKIRNYKNEKSVYDIADFNMFTEELYHSALNDFSQPNEKTFVMKYILSSLSKSVVQQIVNEGKCRLVYAGALYADRRNPERALSVLSQIDDIHVDFYISYSNCNSIVDKYLSETIKSFPAVNRSRYNELIYNEYDILINIGNNFSLQIPSKMLELFSTGRPIINFYQLKDVHYAMVEKYPLGINIGPDDADAVERVSEFCKQMKGKRLSFEEVEALFPENTMDSQLALLEKLIEA